MCLHVDDLLYFIRKHHPCMFRRQKHRLEMYKLHKNLEFLFELKFEGSVGNIVNEMGKEKVDNIDKKT